MAGKKREEEDDFQPGKIAYSFRNMGVVEEEEGERTSMLLFDGCSIGEKLVEELVSEETTAKVLDKLPDRNMGKIEGNAGKVFGKMPSQVRSYADTVKNSRDPGAGHHLSFEPVEEEVMIILQDEILDIGKSWGFALVAYFPTRHPSKEGLQMITNSWQVQVKVIPNINGWITFIFQTESNREKVLRGGPYSIFGRTLLLKVRLDLFKYGYDEIKIVPIQSIFQDCRWFVGV